MTKNGFATDHSIRLLTVFVKYISLNILSSTNLNSKQFVPHELSDYCLCHHYSKAL